MSPSKRLKSLSSRHLVVIGLSGLIGFTGCEFGSDGSATAELDDSPAQTHGAETEPTASRVQESEIDKQDSAGQQPPHDDSAQRQSDADDAAEELEKQRAREQANSVDEQPDEITSVFPENEVPGQEKQTIEIGDNWKRLGKEHEIWIDMVNKQVMAAGHICLRHGPLEVLICPRRTKEHESVISLNATSWQVHTALIALGADPGHPVRWPFGDEQPKYEPATGPIIKIDVKWRDGDAVVQRRGQELVREFASKKPLTQDWVFGGSMIYEDPHSKVKVYYGDSGELVCLSNFATATMDLPIESTQSNEALMYECNPDTIPPLGTKVYVIFTPKIEAKPDDPAKSAEDKSGQPQQNSSSSGGDDDGAATTDDPANKKTGDDGK